VVNKLLGRNEVRGLNRTSVGLKPSRMRARSAGLPCLNRTSVGLKRSRTA